MPHFRKLHIKTVESLDVNDMSNDFVRLTWVLLPLKCCKEGRGMYLGSWLRSNLYPLREDVTSAMVMDAMSEFIQMGMIIAYSVGRREYFQIANWHDYQATSKEAPSPYPSPDTAQLNGKSGASPELVRSKSGVGKTNTAGNPSIYISSSKSTSSSNLKGGLGENGRYEGHIENTRSQELTDIITDICTVVQGGDPIAPSDEIVRMAQAIGEGGAGKVIGFTAWWGKNGQYAGQPAFKSFKNQWQNYLDGVDMTPKSKAEQSHKRGLDAIDRVFDELESTGAI